MRRFSLMENTLFPLVPNSLMGYYTLRWFEISQPNVAKFCFVLNFIKKKFCKSVLNQKRLSFSKELLVSLYTLRISLLQELFVIILWGHFSIENPKLPTSARLKRYLAKRFASQKAVIEKAVKLVTQSPSMHIKCSNFHQRLWKRPARKFCELSMAQSTSGPTLEYRCRSSLINVTVLYCRYFC